MKLSITSGQEKQYRRFVEDAAERALKESGLDKDKDGIQQLISRGGEFQADIVASIKKLAKTNICRLLKIADGRTTEELVRDGKYDYVNPDINYKNFPARARKEKSVKIEFIEGKDFDHDPTSEEVLAEAKRRGLERPVYEDGLYFGVEHPEVQREAPAVFLHEPWRDSVGNLRVVFLWSGVGYRELLLGCFTSRWLRSCRFAFVRKPACR